jgi:hypothetical protein
MQLQLVHSSSVKTTPQMTFAVSHSQSHAYQNRRRRGNWKTSQLLTTRMVLMVLMMMFGVTTISTTKTVVMALSPLRKPTTTTTTTTEDIPAWSNLPFKRNKNNNEHMDFLLEQQQPPTWIQTTELVVGRMAVFSAVALTCTEIGTGRSFPEQIQDAMHILVASL